MTDVVPEWLGLLTVAEVARRLDVSHKTVRRMLDDGTLTKLKVRSGVRIDPAEFAAYKRQLREQGGERKTQGEGLGYGEETDRG